MSIAKIDFSQAMSLVQGERLMEPGVYAFAIEDALSKPNKALSGTNLAVYLKVVKVFEGAGKVGETFSAYYAYEHPNAKAVGLAIARIKELLDVCGLPIGSDEQALVGKTLAAKVELDKGGSLAIESIKPFKITVDKSQTPAKSNPPVINQAVASFESKNNPFEGF